MPIRVTKTYLVDTDNIDEAYELTKISNDKVETVAVGQLSPIPTGTPQQPQQVVFTGPTIGRPPK